MRPAALVLLLLACSGHRAAAPPQRTVDAGTGLLRVGTARADLTLPPGPATFGHGPDSHVSTGFWTRLYCRAFVLDAGGERVALVSCDLPAIGALLQRAVATAASGMVAPNRIFLAATHTHAGPGHFFESEAYAGLLSTRRPGFDPAILDALASRISGAIVEAAKNLLPARARWSHGEAWGLTRNRSLAAFSANGDALPAGHDELPLDQRAIDPALDVLELTAIDGARQQPGVPLGEIVLFAMHPTVLPNTNRLFGADVFGAASRLLEAEMRRRWAEYASARGCDLHAGCPGLPQRRDPLAAIFNTNEGDVSPVWSTGDVAEALEVARKLATRVEEVRVAAGADFDDPRLAARHLELDLASAKLLDGRRALCEKGELGQGAAHGGADHPTSLDGLLPPEPDVEPEGAARRCQSPKKALLGEWLQARLIGPGKLRFPEHVSMGVVRIGDTWLTFVPAELTVHAGRELREQVVRAAPGATARVVGLANAYIQYVATRAEYELQRYEGGSTLYGPLSSEFLAERAGLLARALAAGSAPAEGRALSPGIDEVAAFDYSLGPERERYPRKAAASGVHAQKLLCRLPSPGPRICFAWTDGSPGAVPLGRAPWIRLQLPPGRSLCAADRPLGRRAACDPDAAVDDRGTDFETRIRGREGDGFVWSTLFHPSETEVEALGGERLRIGAGDGFASAEFSLPPGSLRACTAVEAEQCTDL
ncbi:MAG TPA: neutral/alkaline non-lysosomal ceramidase N-terminal domain-containing protein [Myxococcales bacterium]|nr:neutral/alkaline non-lysosomal ceramidase N-terminal domain-containing protein [Myxococcales bacterium]